MEYLATNYLDSSAERFPDKIAFVAENSKITFFELRERAKNLSRTKELAERTNEPIMVLMDKGIDCIVAFMGILYSGNFYVPIDVKSPYNKIQQIRDILDAEIIITDQEEYEIYEGKVDGAECVRYSECIQDNYCNKSMQRVIDADTAFVIFTSGSTGEPKGVVVSHKALMSYIEWGAKAFGFNQDTVFGNQTPFYFSMSIMDIYQTLRNGASMVILKKKVFSFPVRLLDTLIDNKVNTIYWVPTAMCNVANSGALEKRDCSCIKKVLFAGEVMPAKQLNIWRKELGEDVLFANLFGPTEVTDICCYYVIDREFKDDEKIPIGVACENTSVIVLDKNNNEIIKPNVKGELCVKGTILSSGYYNNIAQTNRAFVQNPINRHYPETIYRTGDVVYYNEKGELMYECRLDWQIKHQGHRIELGEIEAVGSSIEGIDRCCCLYDSSKKQIVLFFSGYNEDFSSIVENMKKKMPQYMVPQRIERLDEMPYNSNGKIDRKKLKELFNS